MLRHDTFEAKLARFGEHDRASVDDRLAEHDPFGAVDEPLERLPPRLDRAQAQIIGRS